MSSKWARNLAHFQESFPDIAYKLGISNLEECMSLDETPFTFSSFPTGKKGALGVWIDKNGTKYVMFKDGVFSFKLPRLSTNIPELGGMICIERKVGRQTVKIAFRADQVYFNGESDEQRQCTKKCGMIAGVFSYFEVSSEKDEQ